MRKRAYAVGLLAVLIVVSLRLVEARSDTVPSAPRSQELSQPPGWVAFEADLDTTYPPGADSPRVVGRYYRASDGSERWETGPVDGTVKVISITNVPNATMYTARFGPDSPEGAWQSYSLDFPPGPYRPPHYRLNEHLRASPEKIEGYTVYEMTSQAGDVMLKAPDLNFFTLKEIRALNGRTRTYHNIKRVEPASELFLPPPGATVEHQEQRLPLFRMKAPEGGV